MYGLLNPLSFAGNLPTESKLMKTSEINLKFRTGVSPKQEAKASKSLVASVKKLRVSLFRNAIGRLVAEVIGAQLVGEKCFQRGRPPSGEVGSAFFSGSEPRVR